MELTTVLAKLSILQHLTGEEMKILATETRLVSFADGPIFKEDDFSDGLFIIRSGAAKVTKSSEFGEMEAVLNLLKSETASVKSVSSMVCREPPPLPLWGP